ncbi:MAG: prenyltransferase [Leifsonia sp.]
MTTTDVRPTVLRRLALVSRPVSWINTAFPFAAAYLLTTRTVDATFVIGTLFFLVPYNLALYGVNDVFDYETDLRNPRKGGAEGALLGRGMHGTVVVAAAATTIPFLALLVIVGSTLSWLVLAGSMFAVLAYSVKGLRFKEVAVLDSVTSSVHFVSPALYGLVLAGASFTLQLWSLLAAFLLWGIGSHAFGAVQDVVPDREAGISSIGTVFGARITIRIAIVAWALAGTVALATAWPGPLASLLTLPYIVAAVPYWSVGDAESERANRGWRRFLWTNYGCGFLVTLLLCWYAALSA